MGRRHRRRLALLGHAHDRVALESREAGARLADAVRRVEKIIRARRPERREGAQFLMQSRGAMRTKRAYEIDHSELEFGEELGKGAFGMVKRARWRGIDVRASSPYPHRCAPASSQPTTRLVRRSP